MGRNPEMIQPSRKHLGEKIIYDWSTAPRRSLDGVVSHRQTSKPRSTIVHLYSPT